MLEALKAKYLYKARRNGIICLLLGIVICAIMFKDWLPIGNSLDLDYVSSESEIKEGRASITLVEILGTFMYCTEGYKTDEKDAIARDYIVLTGLGLDDEADGDGIYVGVQLSGKDNKRAYNLMEELWNESEGVDFDSLDIFRVNGHIRKMDIDEEDYLNETVQEMAEAFEIPYDELKAYFPSYILIPNHITGWYEREYISIFGVIMGVLMVVMGFGNLIQGLFGNPIKSIEEYGKKHNGVDAAKMKAEAVFEKKMPSFGITGDDEMFLYDNGSKLFVEDSKDIIWAYEHIVTQKTNFVTTGHTYSIKVRTASGKTIDIPCIQENMHPILSTIHDICPDAVFGFSKEIERVYNKNRIEMINEVKLRREERLARNPYGADTYGETTATKTQSETGTVDNTANNTFDMGSFSDSTYFDPFAEDFNAGAQTETVVTDTVNTTVETATTETAATEPAQETAAETSSDNDKLSGFFS